MLALVIVQAACSGHSGQGGEGGDGADADPPASGAAVPPESSPESGGLPPIAIVPRRANASCLAGPAPVEPVRLQRWFERVPLDSLVAMRQQPGASDAPFYLLEKKGRVLALPPRSDAGPDDAIVALRLSPHTLIESGLTDIAFHPDHERNRLAYLGYVAELSGGGIAFRLSEFRRAENGVALGEERILLEMPKDNPEHVGGALAFGGDGYLYVSIGDDGNNLDGDPNPQRAQDPNAFNGKILRLDVNVRSALRPYGIPADNPIFEGGEPNEVWAMGFRNPWRIAFDSADPETLWVSNVGERRFEEIDRVRAGGNHGWPICEGACDPSDERFVDPLHSYPNQGGAAVVGGAVYRGSDLPTLRGHYVFADYVAQELRALDPALSPNEPGQVRTLARTPFPISGVTQGNDGELYAVGFSPGSVYRLARNANQDAVEPAARLSDTGCFASLTGGDPVPADGVWDYAVAQRFWSDGAAKRRQLALPGDAVIGTADVTDWALPEGGVAIKHFYWKDAIFETRFLSHHEGGAWSGHTYAWDESGDDATLVEAGGMKRTLDGLEWEYPSRGDCLRCHTDQAGHTLSLEARQLNVTLPDGHAQIERLGQEGYLDTGSPERPAPFPSVSALSDEALPLEHRAASWLHVNCSSCHRGEGSAGRAGWDARFDTSFAEKGLCGKTPFEAVGDAPFQLIEQLVAPQDHALSTLWLRAAARDGQIQMPPVGSGVQDPVGARLLADWIDAIAACPPVGDPLPGRVQAQALDAAFDLTPGNAGAVPCDVASDADLEAVSDTGGECAVGLTDPGEWVGFDVHVTTAGTYDLVLRVASGAEPNGRPATVQVRLDDAVLAEAVAVPALGWTAYQDVVVPAVTLPAGNHRLRVTFSTGFANLNWLEVR